jgi:uncharacterized SAM-binding protein YcdF (DUF218 family)
LLVIGIAALVSARALLCVQTGAGHADVIVVLGGESVDRTRKAIDLFHHGAASRVLVSGGGDASFIRDELVRGGVPADVIEIEDLSRNTKENAEFSSRVLKKEKVQRAIIVTSWFHSRRALNSFRRFSPQIRFSSFPANHHEPFSAEAGHVFQEYAKTLWYTFRYRILPWSGAAA